MERSVWKEKTAEERTDFGAAHLRPRLDGSALPGGSYGFEEFRSGFNTAHSHSPGIVVYASSPADVLVAVRW